MTELPLMKEEHRDYLAIPKIESLEKKMLSMPQVPCSVTHRFGPGVYMREVHLPRGGLAIGHHQNFEHINVFIKGHLTLFMEDGTRQELKAPMTFVGKPGRKVAYTHEDCLWMNVYATDETDVEKLEAKYLTKSETWSNDNKERNNIKLLTSEVNRGDYSLFLLESGLTEEYVRCISENKEDMIGLGHGAFKIKTGKSNIEGTGLFATADIEPGELIAIARSYGSRTIAGRYTNHSAFPNAQMRISPKNKAEIELVAIKKINGCQGGQDGEEITIDYRDAFRKNLEALGLGR